jgi:hypothetical protein
MKQTEKKIKEYDKELSKMLKQLNVDDELEKLTHTPKKG